MPGFPSLGFLRRLYRRSQRAEPQHTEWQQRTLDLMLHGVAREVARTGAPVPLTRVPVVPQRQTLLAWGWFNPLGGPTACRLDLAPVPTQQAWVLLYAADHPFTPDGAAVGVFPGTGLPPENALAALLRPHFAANSLDGGAHPILDALPSYIHLIERTGLRDTTVQALFRAAYGARTVGREAAEEALRAELAQTCREWLHFQGRPWDWAWDQLARSLAASAAIAPADAALQDAARLFFLRCASRWVSAGHLPSHIAAWAAEHRARTGTLPSPAETMERLLAQVLKIRMEHGALVFDPVESRAVDPAADVALPVNAQDLEALFAYWFRLVSAPAHVRAIEQAMGEAWVTVQEVQRESGTLARLTGRETIVPWPGPFGG